jgi:acyl carrier protein phosphodiesterase
MKENSHSQEFTDLISSTNEIYSLVETIKTELPTKSDFDGMAEDIESISTRTNKLLLASDESYKALQDNLQEFKLVINDLDERTRNFARESGMDKIDSKLNALNSMVQNGAKTNQVFNQVFEYLAEWVDNASVQINTISEKVDTLDEIEKIKTMLVDLKTDADNNEGVELAEALGTVFDKQTKRISSIESKIDKIIVETTISNENNKLDLAPMENTLNKFLVAIDKKMSSQQERINSLESKLAEVLSLLEEKDTAQLTKKVGGMDRQISKLNKSIEKIASHVIEK